MQGWGWWVWTAQLSYLLLRKMHFHFLFDDIEITQPTVIFRLLVSIHYVTAALISHASKVTLKILQVRLQQYMNRELPDVQAGFRKGRGIRDQIATIQWITEKAREFQKNIYFCFIEYAKAFDCVDHNKLENS